jgi:hypothetical protein
MPKISGNSLDKFNKRCSALHQESNTIEFAIFQFFYDFLEILQESANWLYYWRCTFTPGSLQRTKASQPCPWFTEKPSERSRALQCGPWPWERRDSGQIRRGRRRSRPCKGAGRRARSPMARLCLEFGRKDTRRRHTAVTSGDGRGVRDSGEGSARVGQQATLGAPGSPRGGARVIGWL